jgi:hypothetical protein
MLALKYLLMSGGFGMILVAVGILGYDLYAEMLYRRALTTPGATVPPEPKRRWRTSLALAFLAWGPILLAFSIVIVPTGMAGVRVSQTSGTVPGTLYPGVHMVKPLVEDVSLFDTRDQVFTTGVAEDGKIAADNVAGKGQLLNVQAKEGLMLGLAITVRYRLDPELHGSRCVFGEAGRSTATGRGVDHAEACVGWNHREGSHAARYSSAGGVCQGTGDASAQGTRERSHERRD